MRDSTARQNRNGRTLSKRQQLPHSAFGEPKEQYGVPLRDASSTLLSFVSGLHLVARLLEVHIGFPRNRSLGLSDLGASRPRPRHLSSAQEVTQMAHSDSKISVELFATCPQSKDISSDRYARSVADVARWSEQCGCKGILVYTDNSIVDPWLVSQIIIENTRNLCPLVAIQPVYMHPYSVAKMVASLGFLYGRRVYLNLVAGGFKNDLAALNDTTAHDKRYVRIIEYTNIIKRLLAGPEPVTVEGEFYKVDKLRMTPPLAPELFPGIFISGSSEAGLEAAKAIGATAVKYPKPAREYEGQDDELDCGVRVGIIARSTESEAWEVAEERFPEDRKGELTHQVAMKISDSQWHKQLSALAEESKSGRSPYWLRPFETYKTFCPYLVGSYEAVAEELSRYISVGHSAFILDIPPTKEELHHTQIAFEQATKTLSDPLKSDAMWQPVRAIARPDSIT
jgi:alkanesulfonate monooxygenase